MITPFPIPVHTPADGPAIGSPALAGGPVDGTADVPPTGNTGGKVPAHAYEVIDPDTGEVQLLCPTLDRKGFRRVSATSGVKHAAITDWLNCTFQFNESEESLPELFHELFSALGSKFAAAVQRKAGLHHYERSFLLGETNAIFCIGGQRGTVLLSLPGEACSVVEDWNRLSQYLQTKQRSRITRWDGAVDDFFGVHSIDWAVEQYLAGAFKTGGNKPSCSNDGNWTDPDGTGRTFYVGNAKNGKEICIYEKGQQLGALWHPWVRYEVRLQNVDRVIPWDVLLDPARYVVGAYPRALSWVQEEMTRVRTIRKQIQLSYEHQVSHASMAYGPLINVMLQVEGSPEQVIKKLAREGTPKRLQHPFVDSPSEFVKAARDDASEVSHD